MLRRAFENVMRTLNPHSIYQTDSNYDLNVTSLEFSIHQILTLFFADPDFFKKLFSTPWSNPKELKEAMVNSVATIPMQETLKYLNSIPYFKQLEIPRPDKNIEILPFSNDLEKLTGNRPYSTESYPVKYVQDVVVIGQSNTPSLYLLSHHPDPSIFGWRAEVIVDGRISYSTVVSSRTDKNRVNLNLPNGIHTIKAVVATDNATYTDSIIIPNGLFITTDGLPIGSAPLNVIFDVKSDFNVDKLEWDFDGDGVIDMITTNLKVSHVYSNPGIYKPIVRIYGDGNKKAIVEAPIVIVKSD